MNLKRQDWVTLALAGAAGWIVLLPMLCCGGCLVRSWSRGPATIADKPQEAKETLALTAEDFTVELVRENATGKIGGFNERELEVLPPLRTGITREQAKWILTDGNGADWGNLQLVSKLAICRYAIAKLHAEGNQEVQTHRAGLLVGALDLYYGHEDRQQDSVAAACGVLDRFLRDAEKKREATN